MGFSKTARAAIVHPNWGTQNWTRFVEEHRKEMQGTGYRGLVRTASGAPNLVDQASAILQDQFSPDKYLLTHATIVASVDTDDVGGIRMGAVNEMGRRVNRKWANYRVRPACDIYINNNHDCWDRPVLLKSYRTFVGAHNFVEHVQIEEQSKGRIIDAAARDIGDSVYIDILIATDRRHASLIRDIESGRMGTMSMGCSVTETQCTKCGNVAADETEMCEHIKYAKGNYEFDGRGNKYRIAELCGHHSLDPTGGVTFIEASWVAIPAFQGAVMRNVLEPETININTQSQMRQILASPPKQWTDDSMLKAARLAQSAGAILAGEEEAPDPLAPPPGDDAGGAPDPMAPPPAGGADPMAPPPADPMAPPGGAPGAPGGEEKDPMEELEGDLKKYLLDKIKKDLKKEMAEEVAEDATSSPELGTSTNENINKQAQLVAGTDALLRIARSDVELLDGLARLKASHGIKVSRELYRTVLRVGSTDGHESPEKYLQRCAAVLTRQPTVGEAKTLVRLGRILSLRKKTRF
jgi:hypothetical protein